MSRIKLLIAVMFLVSGFSASGASRDYISVFKQHRQKKNTAKEFQINLMQDLKMFSNILLNKKTVASLKKSQKKTAADNKASSLK